MPLIVKSIYCSACGKRLGLRRRPLLRLLVRVERLVGELLRADRMARCGAGAAPPEVCSALVDIGSEIERALEEGWAIMGDLHAAAHGARAPAIKSEFRRWESSAERVLFEVLAALELHER